MDGSVSVAGVADLKMCYLAGYIYERNTQNTRTHIWQSVDRGGRRQILTEEKAMRREQSVPDEAVNVHVNDTSDGSFWTP